MTARNDNFIVRAALAEDINGSVIWFSHLPCSSREIVKITNKLNLKSIWCEIIKASDNFIQRYNQNPRTKNISHSNSFVIVNQWYREKLGIKKNEVCSIEIAVTSKPFFLKQLFASYEHPDNTVRIAANLAFVSVILGGLGLLLGAVSLCK